MNVTNNQKKFSVLFLAIALLFAVSNVNAAANWQVVSFSCTPTEVAVGSAFSCTAQVQNTGDDTGTLTTATLFGDENNWLESTSYAQTVSTSIDSGASTEVTFTGLRASSTGVSGFSKITLDSITDTEGVEDVTVNAINVVATVSESASSVSDGSDSVVTASIIAGGNIDVETTFSGSSGCSISNQDATKTISNMQNGESTSRSWTATVSSSSCTYTITTIATGVNGLASKTDTSSATITCTDCPEDDDDSSSTSGSGSGGGGDGGSGSGAVGADVIALTTEITSELGQDEAVSFSIAGESHSLTILDLTATTVTFELRSHPITATLKVGEEQSFDLDHDDLADLAVRVTSINFATKKAKLRIRPVSSDASVGEDTKTDDETTTPTKVVDKQTQENPEIQEESNQEGSFLSTVLIILGVVLVIIIIL